MWPNPQFPAYLIAFTEEILNGKFRFLYSYSSVRIFTMDSHGLENWNRSLALSIQNKTVNMKSLFFEIINDALFLLQWCCYCNIIKQPKLKLKNFLFLDFSFTLHKFSIKDFFIKCDQICCFLRIWSHLLKEVWVCSYLAT